MVFVAGLAVAVNVVPLIASYWVKVWSEGVVFQLGLDPAAVTVKLELLND